MIDSLNAAKMTNYSLISNDSDAMYNKAGGIISIRSTYSCARALKKKEEGPSICIARRREYTSNEISSLKLSRGAVQVTAHSLHRLRTATQ